MGVADPGARGQQPGARARQNGAEGNRLEHPKRNVANGAGGQGQAGRRLLRVGLCGPSRCPSALRQVRGVQGAARRVLARDVVFTT